MHIVDQTQHFQGIFQVLRCTFYFDQQSQKILQILHSRSYNSLNFFVDKSITDAKFFFGAPTQPGMMSDDTVRLVCVYMLLLREIFCGSNYTCFTGTQVLGQFGETGSEYPKSCARTQEK